MAIPGRIAAILAASLLFAPTAFAQEELPPGARVGAEIPEISGVDLSENPIDLKDVIGKKTVILSFWSIYCSDCVRELDDLRAIRAEFPVEEVEVVAVNTDNAFPVSRIASFVRRYEGARGAALDVLHVIDRNETIVKTLGIRYIPLMLTVNKSGVVSSVIGGYHHEQDRDRLYLALEQGRVALGAWGEKMRGRVRSILRGVGPDGNPVEWGSFHVEEGQGLFGWYDDNGWRADILWRTGRAREEERVAKVVNDRLRLSLMRDSLDSIGIRLPEDREGTYQPRGILIPESPMEMNNRWRKLFQDLGFAELYRIESQTGRLVGDEYWGVLVGDVELGRLRTRLRDLGFPTAPNPIRVSTVSDSDYKPRTLMKFLGERSYRVQSFQGETLYYYGTEDMAISELKEITIPGMGIFVEKNPGGGLRIEIF